MKLSENRLGRLLRGEFGEQLTSRCLPKLLARNDQQTVWWSSRIKRHHDRLWPKAAIVGIRLERQLFGDKLPNRAERMSDLMCGRHVGDEFHGTDHVDSTVLRLDGARSTSASRDWIFLAIQTQIDAIDRAIADEESLQPPTSSSAEFGRR